MQTIFGIQSEFGKVCHAKSFTPFSYEYKMFMNYLRISAVGVGARKRKKKKKQEVH